LGRPKDLVAPVPSARVPACFDGPAALAAALLLAACADSAPVVSGTVESRRVSVSCEVAARVRAVHVREAQSVDAGQLLVELDDSLPAARAAAARAGLEVAEAELALLEAGSRPEELAAAQAELEVRREALKVAEAGARAEELAQLEASLESVAASIRLAELTLERERELLASGTTAQARMDEAVARLAELSAQRARIQAELALGRAGARLEDRRAREAELAAAQARFELVRQGARAEERQIGRSRVAVAQAELEAAEVELARCRVLAPLAGEVEIVDVEPGELAQPGQPLVALARRGPLRVRTYAPQASIGSLAPGDTLRLTVDGRPDRALEARVERIWDEAEFTTGNVQTPQDRMLLVYRVDLELAGDPEAGLRPGASVLVDFSSRSRP
jgi:HlyD family secretion protein